MTHSLKKLQRRAGIAGLKANKNKMKAPTHPGHRPLNRRQQKLKESEGDDAEGTKDAAMQDVAPNPGKEKRKEMREEIGKQSRLDLVAKRRGVLPTQLDGDQAAAVEEEAGNEMLANAIAKRALSFAPSNQRSFHRELGKVIKEADVILEVLDARDPLGCRCVPLEDAVMQRWRAKRIVIILNKVDLVPRDTVARWLVYLRQYFPTLPFKASTQNQKNELKSSSRGAGAQHRYGAEAYGGDSLLGLIKNYSRSLNLKSAITVGVVGYPNVGKSSLINSLKRARAVNVGSTPGVTTMAQTVSLDSKVKLMDCPGIVFARASNAEQEADVMLRNCVKVEKLDDPTTPIDAILRKVGTEALQAMYDVAPFSCSLELLTLVSFKRGHIRKGGAPDLEGAARAVLHDWNTGSLKFHTEPPAIEAETELLTELAGEFDWNAPARVEEKAPAAEKKRAQPTFHTATIAASAAGGEAMVDHEVDEHTGGWGWAQGSRGRDGARGEAKSEGARRRQKKGPRQPPTKRVSALSDEHDRFNFQANRNIRKNQKVEKRRKSKQENVSWMTS